MVEAILLVAAVAIMWKVMDAISDRGWGIILGLIAVGGIALFILSGCSTRDERLARMDHEDDAYCRQQHTDYSVCRASRAQYRQTLETRRAAAIAGN